MRVVAKLGTSSLTDEHGVIDQRALDKVGAEVAQLRDAGHEVVLVSSGAVASGLPALGLTAEQRPKDARTLQAISAVGQARLVQSWNDALAEHGLVAGQVLLVPLDFMVRTQYLQARATLERLLELGVVPVVNENDAIADDEIRFGDNDRMAALVSHLIRADVLVLLTDTPGLMDADPRLEPGASLIAEIVEVDHELESLAGGAGTARGSGGMASKLAAAKMASWSGVRTVIAAADRPQVLVDAVEGRPGVGTTVVAQDRRLPARKLWIAFALPAEGRIVVDDGAVRALTRGGRSLLAAGVVAVEGEFAAEDAVEIVDRDGAVVAKGLAKVDSATLTAMAGRSSEELFDHSGEAVHRDDLVVLP
ncbi:MAG TPA: glutamate 5-kinase [Microthrixaceae bacterium]|nr:glutamate 5-kinase [Microthrixaceae bacterium]